MKRKRFRMSEPENRSIVGRFVMSPGSCELEFVPSSTSAKYRCELVGVFGSLAVVESVHASEYVVVGKWHWLGQSSDLVNVSTIVIDASSVTPTNSKEMERSESVQMVSGKEGIISSVSTFLRIKDTNDPFNNAFCVHLSDATTFVLRGEKLVLFQYLFQPGGRVVFSGFRKIKLKTFENRILSISTDESRVSQYQALDKGMLRNARLGSGMTDAIRARIVGIKPPLVLVTVLATHDGQIEKSAILSLSRWGKCDKRRLSPGAIVTLHGAHRSLEGSIALCPANSSMQIEYLPPLVKSISIHSIESAGRDTCLTHLTEMDACSVTSFPKFSINSLCRCECIESCETGTQVQTSLRESQNWIGSTLVESSQRKEQMGALFTCALQESELKLSLLRISDIFTLKAPPLFNVSLEGYVGITSLLGSPDSRITKTLSGLPRTLHLALFPQSKPLNSYVAVEVTQGGEDSLVVLISRDVPAALGSRFAMSQILILNAEIQSPVHAICMHNETLLPMEGTNVAVLGRSSGSPNSPVNSKLSRRRELDAKLRELGLGNSISC